MIDLTEFKLLHIHRREISSFSMDELNIYKGKLSDEAIDFLSQEGKATYSNDFFRTTLPNTYHDLLNEWGLDGPNCYVFMKTCFGSLIYYYESKYYSLNPYDGSLTKFGKKIDLLLNGYFIAPIILDVTLWFKLHQKNINVLPALKEDEIYALDPTIPEGGSPETSKIVVVKLKEHLQKLADLFDHTTTE